MLLHFETRARYRVENQGQISHFLTPENLGIEWMKWLQWILQVQSRIKPLTFFQWAIARPCGKLEYRCQKGREQNIKAFQHTSGGFISKINLARHKLPVICRRSCKDVKFHSMKRRYSASHGETRVDWYSDGIRPHWRNRQLRLLE